MNANSSSRLIMCGGLLILSALAGAVETVVPTPESLTVKQHLIKWMLTDKQFVEKAAMGSRAEIELSQLALEKGQSQQVRGFAKTMVQDHSMANTELRSIAQNESFPLPEKLDSAHQDDIDRLKNLSDAKFDAAYIEIMQRDHENAVSFFTAAAADEKLDPQLRGYAQKILPTLLLHKEHSRALGANSTAAAD